MISRESIFAMLGLGTVIIIVAVAGSRKAKATPAPAPKPKIPTPTPDMPEPDAPEPEPGELRSTPPEHLGWYTRGSFTIVTGLSGDPDRPWYWAVFGGGAEDAPEGWPTLFDTRSQIIDGTERDWFDARRAAERWVDEREPPPPKQEAPFKLSDFAELISEEWGKTLAPQWLVEGGAPNDGDVLGWYTYRGFWIRVDGLHDVDSTEGHPHGRVRWVVLGGDATPLASGFFGEGFSEVMSFEDENTDAAAGLAAQWIDGVTNTIGAGKNNAGAATAVDVALDDDGVGAGGLWGHMTPVAPLPITFKKKSRWK